MGSLSGNTWILKSDNNLLMSPEILYIKSYYRYNLVILMVKLKIKVGPKGQIIIPKALREAYNIVEGGNVIIEPKDEGILIRKIMSEEELINWLQERKRRLKAKKAKLGELSGVYLEMEFEEE